MASGDAGTEHGRYFIFDDDVFSLVRENWHSYASNRRTLPAGL